MTLHPLIRWTALAALLSLAACGGGNDNAALAVDDTVPATALASPEAYTGYAAGLPQDERREPLSVDGLVPPASETAEPAPIER
jgi:hypothetical protein